MKRRHKGASDLKTVADLRGVPADRGVAAPKMADNKGPAREKVTEMTKISIKMANGELPQGKKAIRGS